LSDNPAKATGRPDEIARYLHLFGDAGRVEHAVKV
jgi:nicotinate phosphoribosyltransferase